MFNNLNVYVDRVRAKFTILCYISC